MINRLLENKWSLVLLGYLAFILYGTTLPFRFSLDANVIQRNLNQLMAVFSETPLYWKYNESDMVANILFFIPFGLFLFNLVYYKQDTKLKFRIVLLITLLGFLLSCFVETIQLFSPRRTSSFHDVLTNTFGSFCGALMGYYLYKRKIFHKIHHYLEDKLKNPLFVLMWGYIIFIILIGFAPFNFNLSPRFVSLRILHLKIIENSFIEKPVNLFSLLFLYGPGGYIFTHYLVKRLNRSAWGKPALLALVFGTGLCIFIETGQFLISSRSFSVSDILVGILGIILGSAVYMVFHRGDISNKQVAIADRYRKLLILISLCYFIFVVYKYLYPFTFIPDNVTITRKIDFFLFNLLSYAPSNRLWTLLNITLKNWALYLPLGMIFREFGTHFIFFSKRIVIISTLTLIILALKSLQFINFQQVPLLFDFFGILLGILSGYYFWKEIRDFLIKDYPIDE